MAATVPAPVAREAPAPAPRSRHPPSMRSASPGDLMGRWTAGGLGVVAGTAWQVQQAALPAMAVDVALIAAAVLLAAVAGRVAGWRGWLVCGVCGALAACAAADLRAGSRLAERLPPALEGRDLSVTGRIASLPQRAPDGWRFTFDAEQALADGQPVQLPRRLAIGWYAQPGAELPSVRAGQRWTFVLRLKRPHGLLNPSGFDLELMLFEQGVGATGSVRVAADAPPRLRQEAAGFWLDRLRQTVRDRILASGLAPAVAGVLAALVVGDQAAIPRDGWALYRSTGVAHLMSISGLHVTMFAWLAAGVAGRLWRRWPAALTAVPAPTAARWSGVAAACAYAAFAGWGVPAQRTLWMLATAAWLAGSGLRWPWPLVWGGAAVAVTVLDPWALLQPGFWLSFTAVGLLLASSGVQARASSPTTEAPAWRRAAAGLLPAMAAGVRTQAVATVGLAPLTLVFFQQLSLVGFAANLLAIPLVTLLITPLALLGVFVPALWIAAGWLVGWLDAALQLLAAPPLAVWSVAAPAAWAAAAGLLGAAVALLPLPRSVRLLAVPLVLPLLWPALPRPAPGAFEVMAVDVGQGTAVLVRTATHTLLYDTGPQYSREADAGERVLLPLLRALGERRLDLLVLSHRDTDHVGGAGAVLRGVPVGRLASSLEPAHPLLALARERRAEVGRCEAGQRWQWDGVEMAVLHPTAAALDAAQDARAKPNTLSCVLRIVGRWATGGGAPAEHALLLAGDLEQAQEARLVQGAGADAPHALGSDVLLVPHHGSKTSSSDAFLRAVAPHVAVVQAGYRNRFGHPAPAVLERYAAHGIAVVTSARCGAWQAGPAGMRCERQARRRYWHDGPDAAAPEGPGTDPHGADIPGTDNGVEVASPAMPDTAADAAAAAPDGFID